MPEALVVTTQVAPLQGAPKDPVGPLTGAENVTLVFGMTAPLISFTIACRLTANAVLIEAFCGVPALAAMEVGFWSTVTVSDEVTAVASVACAVSPAP